MCSEVGADDFSDGDSFDTGASTAYRVEPSDGVHVTAKANAVYSHLLATHLLRTVLP